VTPSRNENNRRQGFVMVVKIIRRAAFSKRIAIDSKRKNGACLVVTTMMEMLRSTSSIHLESKMKREIGKQKIV
jgi:hypothetical protein